MTTSFLHTIITDIQTGLDIIPQKHSSTGYIYYTASIGSKFTLNDEYNFIHKIFEPYNFYSGIQYYHNNLDYLIVATRKDNSPIGTNNELSAKFIHSPISGTHGWPIRTISVNLHPITI